MIGKHQVVALEEHYWDPEVAEHFTGTEGRAPALRARLDDVGALRIKEMDEAGIDLTVLSMARHRRSVSTRRQRSASPSAPTTASKSP